MIRRCARDDLQEILRYAYEREPEHLFLIGSLDRPHAFEENRYYGWFEAGEIHGICTFFGVYGNLVAHADDLSKLSPLIDAALQDHCRIETVAAYRRFAEPTIARLRVHGIIPSHQSDEIVHRLDRRDFQNFSCGDEERARVSDVDECVLLERRLMADWRGEAPDLLSSISDIDRARVRPEYTWVLRMNGRIISKATVHGVSKNFVQLGGVSTHPNEQRKGNAKRVVSALCAHYFSLGLPYAILFMRSTNEPARKLYAALGFRPVDEFLIAEYSS